MDDHHLFWDFFQALLYVQLYMWNNGAPYALGVGVWNGFKTIHITSIENPEVGTTHVVCLQVPDGQLLSIRAILRSGPISIYQAAFAPEPPAGQTPPYSGYAAKFEEIVLAKKLIIDSWTDGICGTTGVQTNTAAGGLAVSGTWLTPISTGVETFATDDKLFYTKGSEAEGVYEGHEAPPVTPGPGVAGGGGGGEAQLEKISQTLDDMSRTSRVTWINNNGGFAELASGDIVTPGGEG